MLVHAGGAASTASALRKGSWESDRETYGLRWGARESPLVYVAIHYVMHGGAEGTWWCTESQ